MIPIISLLSIGKKIITSKIFIYVVVIASLFLAGYFYKGMRTELKEAKIITQEVIKYVEKSEAIKVKYKKIDINDKKTKENILSGRISAHYNP